MLLKGQNGNEFELGFTRESLPDAQDGAGDANWATANFRAATAGREWEENAPCLNLFEFRTLADWLEAVGNLPGQSAEPSEIELLQPELRFSVANQDAQQVNMRIYFHLANRPEEFEVDTPTDEADYIDINTDRVRLRLAGAELREALREFENGNLKDDLTGDAEYGQLGQPDPNANALNTVTPDPPGISFDADEGYLEEDERKTE